MKTPSGTRYIDLIIALAIGLVSCAFSGDFSYTLMLRAAAVSVAVFVTASLVPELLGVGKLNPWAMLTLLLWPGLFKLQAGFGISAGAGLLAMIAVGVMLSSGSGWAKKLLLAGGLALSVVGIWFVGTRVPVSSSALLPSKLMLPTVSMVFIASLAILLRGNIAKTLIRPQSVALFSVATAGFLMAYVFLSSAYIAPLRSGGDWAGVAAVAMFAIAMGSSEPQLIILSVLWAGLLGPSALIIAALSGTLVIFGRNTNFQWAAWGAAGASALLVGVIPWAKQGAFGFLPQGLLLATGLVFAGTASASKSESRWFRVMVVSGSFLVAALVSGSAGLAVGLLILAVIGVILSLGKKPVIWWAPALLGLFISGTALLQPWHLKLKPQGVEIALRGRELYQHRDLPAALVYLTRQQLGPEDFKAAALCAIKQGSDPLPILETGLARFPGETGLASLMLDYLWRRGRSQDMILWSRRLQSQGFLEPISMRALGKGMVLSNRFTDGAQAFLLQFLLGDPDGLLYLADIYQRKPLFQQAREMGADFKTVYQDLISTHLRRADTTRAVEYAKALASSYPDDTAVARLLKRISP